MTREFLRALYAHMEWADALVWQTALTHAEVGADDYVVESLVHLHMVQHAYLSVWNGEEFTMPTRDDFDGLTEIREWAREFHPAAAGFIAGLAGEGLTRVIPIPWTEFLEEEIGGPISPATLGDMLYQVAAHSAHHRAQINRRVRELGMSAAMVDYIGWVWRGKPAPDWSES